MSKSQVEFVTNHQPILKDGSHTISLEHTLKYGGATQTFVKTKSFVVAGPRFSLNPQNIVQVFPPDKSRGHFDNVLPHIVFSRRTLPWERQAETGQADKSWLALLVFIGGNTPKLQTGTLADLYPASAPDGGGQLPAGIWSYGSGVSGAFLEYGEKADDPCLFIDVPKRLFAAMAPSLNDLEWNAHARKVTNPGQPEEEFAVVVGNRLFLPGTTCTMHLVSLEGLGSQLPLDNGDFAGKPAWKSIRLVSLKCWRVIVAPLEASFAHLIQGLNGGVDARSEELGDSQLRLPTQYQPVAAKGLKSPATPFDSGYTVLADPNGKPSWYRGPLAPSTVTPLPADTPWAKTLPADSSHGLTVKVSTNPDQDVSLAAAWQLGRLVALADEKFATAQVSWKRDVRLSLNIKLGQSGTINAGSRSAYAAAVRAVLSDAAQIQKLLGASLTVTPASGLLTIPQDLVDWLGRLALLDGLPVNYLVPDIHMLPNESLKLFNVDPRWLACLLDGAWSLDRQPRAHWALDAAYQPWRQLLDGSLKASFLPAGACHPVSGLILNSQVIPDYWPGIQFQTNAATLREQKLGPSTLLLLFDQALSRLTIRQPPEGIHFGFNIAGLGNISKPLRYVTIGGTTYPKPSGRHPPANGTPAPQASAMTKIPQRITNLIQFAPLAAAMKDKLGVPAAVTFSTAEFALELVEPVSSVSFTLP